MKLMTGQSGHAKTSFPVVVATVNKWELEGAKQEELAELREMFERQLPQLRTAGHRFGQNRAGAGPAARGDP
jgi:hypothetical protein